MTDSEDVLVASTQVSDTTASTSANTCCLTLSSSKTASMTKSASAKSALSVEPVTSALSRLALSALRRPLALSLSISPWTYATPLSTRAWSRSVRTTGTSSRCTNSSASWLAMRPGADDADLGDRAGQRLVRSAGGPLGALLHEVEGVQARAQLVAHDEVGERVVLGGEALVARGGLAPRR